MLYAMAFDQNNVYFKAPFESYWINDETSVCPNLKAAAEKAFVIEASTVGV